MKRPLAILMLCLLAGCLAWWQLREPPRASPSSPPQAMPPATVNEPTPPAAPIAAANPPPAPPAGDDAPPNAVEGPRSPREKRAYLLSLDQGTVTYVNAQDIEGDFAPKRGREEVWSNMLRCRLLSKNNAVLAEELLPAPDHVCKVLDPRSPDGKPVNFTTPGPTIFQVRLPRVKDAHRLEIFRIQTPGPPTVEKLLGSLTLPPP